MLLDKLSYNLSLLQNGPSFNRLSVITIVPMFLDFHEVFFQLNYSLLDLSVLYV